MVPRGPPRRTHPIARRIGCAQQALGLLGLTFTAVTQPLVLAPALLKPGIPGARVGASAIWNPARVPASAAAMAVRICAAANFNSLEPLFARRLAASAKPAPMASFWAGFAL